MDVKVEYMDSQDIDGIGILGIPLIINNTSTRHNLLFRVIICQLDIHSLCTHKDHN
jgi:hypothetical protein